MKMARAPLVDLYARCDRTHRLGREGYGTRLPCVVGGSVMVVVVMTARLAITFDDIVVTVVGTRSLEINRESVASDITAISAADRGPRAPVAMIAPVIRLGLRRVIDIVAVVDVMIGHRRQRGAEGNHHDGGLDQIALRTHEFLLFCSRTIVHDWPLQRPIQLLRERKTLHMNTEPTTKSETDRTNKDDDFSTARSKTASRRSRHQVALRVAFACLGLIAGRESIAAPVEYRVRFEPEQVMLDVSTCVANAAKIERFRTFDTSAAQFLQEPTRSSGQTVDRRGTRLSAANWRAGECLQYRVDVDAIAAKLDMDVGYRVDGDRLISASVWLWRPQDVDRADQAEIAFELPVGWSLSTPWHPVDEAPHRRFLVGTTPGDWTTLVAIGHFAEELRPAGEGFIRFDMLGRMPAEQTIKLRRYVTASVNDVASAFPDAFAHSLQLLTVPVEHKDKAVPFGMSMRGGGQAIWLYVDPSHTASDFDQDWTLTHELVHTLHPHLGSEGRWIAEGIATYYQNVLRARSGRLTARAAWNELDAGFGRGRADRTGLTLGKSSVRMEEKRWYMRVYWSGTALMLLADVALRTRPEHPSSLDAALNGFVACCRDRAHSLEPAEFLAALDRVVGGNILTRLYQSHVTQIGFPDLTEAYRQLGLQHGDGGVTLSGDPAAVALRDAIMQGDPHYDK